MRRFRDYWRFAALPLILVCGIFLASCGGSGDESEADSGGGGEAEQGPIVVGFAGAKSGFMQPFDQATLAGAELAAADINEAGGVDGRQIEILTCDTKSERDLAGECANDLIGQGAQIIGPSCDFDFGGPAAVQAQANNLIAFGCVGSPKFGLDGIGNNAFNVPPTSYSEGASAAEWAYDQGWRSVYILTDTFIDYTKEVAAAFKDRWAKLAGADSILQEDSFNNADASIAAQVSGISQLSDDPDFIFMPSCPPGGASAARQIRAAGIDVPILSDTCMQGEFWLDAVPNLKDFYTNDYVCTTGEDPRPEVNEFYERFRSETDPEVQAAAKFGPVGYTIIQLIAEAAQQSGGTDADGMREALEGLDGFETLLGPVTYSSDIHFDISRPLMFQVVEGGKQKCLGYWEMQSPVEPELG